MHELGQAGPGVTREEIDERYAGVLRRLRGSRPGERLAAFLSQDRERLVDRALWQAELDHLQAVVQATLRSLSGTALVCENDSLALYCLTMLRSMGVRVPEDRSVVGFDDEEDAFLCGLSSYNFNVAAIVAAMVDFIVRPHSAPAAGAPVVIDGYVKSRTTTAPPGQAREWILP